MMMMDMFSDYRQRNRTSGVSVRGRERAVLRSRDSQQSQRPPAESPGTGHLSASAGRRLRDVFHRTQQTGREDRVSVRRNIVTSWCRDKLINYEVFKGTQVVFKMV